MNKDGEGVGSRSIHLYSIFQLNALPLLTCLPCMCHYPVPFLTLFFHVCVGMKKPYPLICRKTRASGRGHATWVQVASTQAPRAGQLFIETLLTGCF